jgi:hypothetical protein
VRSVVHLIGRQRPKRRSHALGFTGVTVDGAPSSTHFRCEGNRRRTVRPRGVGVRIRPSSLMSEGTSRWCLAPGAGPDGSLRP